MEFKRELEQLLMKHQMNQGSDTPCHALADYLVECLAAFNRATCVRIVTCGGRLDPYAELD